MIYHNKHSIVWAMNSGDHMNWDGARAEVHLLPMVHPDHHVLVGTIESSDGRVAIIDDNGGFFLIACTSESGEFQGYPFMTNLMIHA